MIVTSLLIEDARAWQFQSLSLVAHFIRIDLISSSNSPCSAWDRVSVTSGRHLLEDSVYPGKRCLIVQVSLIDYS